jgi:hypothetical protein
MTVAASALLSLREREREREREILEQDRRKFFQ